MEPISITVAGIAAALAAKAGDRAIDATVEGGEGLLHRISERIRRRFVDEGDSEAIDLLNLLERAPDSEQVGRELEAAIHRHAAADLDFAAELAEFGEGLRTSGGAGAFINQRGGDGSILIAGVSDSHIRVDRGPPPSTWSA